MFAAIRASRFATAALALTLATGLAACDNPVEEEHEEHPIGLIVSNSAGVEVARFNVESSPQATGRITVGRTGPQTFTVVGIAEDGDQLPLDGLELELTVSSASASTATAAVQATNQLVITGVAAGTTEITLALEHDGHPEFQGQIPVVVQ